MFSSIPLEGSGPTAVLDDEPDGVATVDVAVAVVVAVVADVV